LPLARSLTDLPAKRSAPRFSATPRRKKAVNPRRLCRNARAFAKRLTRIHMRTFLDRRKRWMAFILIAGVAGFSAPAARGASRQWLGGGVNQFWNTATNWVGGIAPTNLDSAVFPPVAAQKATVYNLP